MILSILSHVYTVFTFIEVIRVFYMAYPCSSYFFSSFSPSLGLLPTLGPSFVMIFVYTLPHSNETNYVVLMLCLIALDIIFSRCHHFPANVPNLSSFIGRSCIRHRYIISTWLCLKGIQTPPRIQLLQTVLLRALVCVLLYYDVFSSLGKKPRRGRAGSHGNFNLGSWLHFHMGLIHILWGFFSLSCLRISFPFLICSYHYFY